LRAKRRECGMRDVTGTKLLRWTGARSGCRRVCQWLPRRELWFRVVLRSKQLLIHWRPHAGLWCVAVERKGIPNDPTSHSYPRPKEHRVKRRLPPAGAADLVPPLAHESSILVDLPLVRQFLTATQYEDKTARTPGYWWLMNRVTAFEVILFDPDSGSRLPCRAADLDSALLLAERLLGTEDAPWEQDRYLMEQLQKRSKKSRKAS
jgi:hypothetical protein